MTTTNIDLEKLKTTLTEGLPQEQVTEFYRLLHETGISRYDVEILLLMRTLGTFHKLYAEIPKSIHAAADRMQKVDAAIEGMTNSLNQSLNDFDELTGSIGSHVKEASQKALNLAAAEMRGISTDFKENLKTAMNESLPLDELKEAGKTFTDTIAAGNQAAAELRKNIKITNWTRTGAIAAATLVVIVASWLVIYFHYQSRFEKARLSVVNRVIEQVDDNRAVLDELAKANRRLELSRSESGTKLLAISNAKGYTSTSKAGVIEFK
jgi:phage-related protein